MNQSPHRLILASAGTGKTYQLSGHFLRLLLCGAPPERVLATTFTRKAAGEILDRVLERLLSACDDPRALAALQAQVPDRTLSHGLCLELLARLTRRLDRFRVRTLDSFFVHLAQVFALDLALPPEWTLVEELEDAELRARALGRVLGESSQAERLELLRGLQRDGAARSVHGTLLAIVREARQLALESTPHAWAAPDLPEAPAADELPELAARLAALEIPRTKAGSPNQQWSSNLARAGKAVATNDWEALLELTLVKRVLEGGDRFGPAPIPDEAAEVLGELARFGARELIATLGRRTEVGRAFLERFEQAYQQLKRERGAFLFEDLPLALAPAGGTGAHPLEERELEMWFRLDGRLDHLLLDEFQDTAPAQWRALAPLAEEVLADGTGERSFFCVGDVKQSIYGWRQAEPRLLAGLAERYPALGEPESLRVSYRSSPVVLDTVNRVFGALGTARLLLEEGFEAQRRAACEWLAGFEPHESAKQDLPGAALLLEASWADGDRSRAEAVRRLTVERVVALAAAAPRASIGVLVRTGKPIPGLLQALNARGLRASGEGGNPLVDSEAVQVLLSALHLADHPGDTAAALHVATSALGPALGLGPGDEADAERRRAAARALRAQLVERGYGPFVADLLPAVEADEAYGAWDRSRFRQLVDLAYAFEPRAGLRPTAFAEHVRATGVEDPTASAVRVMTIHKSKGLEFDAVVLPELDAPLVRSRSRFVGDRPDPFGPIERVSLRPRKVLQSFSRPLRELAEAAEARELGESLCVLYVAMTRAARHLEMILPPPNRSGKESEARNYATLLRELLGAEGPAEGGVLWRHPHSHPGGLADLSGSAPPPPAPEPRPLRLAPGRGPRSIPRRTPSGQEGGAARPADLLRAPAKGAARLGTLVHRLLEEVEWAEGFERRDAELLELLAPLEPDAAPRRRALELFRAALEADELRGLLARPAGPARVLREQAFAVLLPEDSGEVLWTGSIDRLVLLGDAAQPRAAQVVDFKTDRVEEGRLPARIEHYRPQLESYRRVVAAQTGLSGTAVTCYLAFVALGRVMALPAR